MDNQDKKDYEVGYKRPPRATQFKSGESGNPKGRQKLKKAFKTDLQEELDEIITIHEAGKSKPATKQRALLKRLIASALSGDNKAIRILTQLIASFGKDVDNSEPKELSVDDKDIIQEFLERGNFNA